VSAHLYIEGAESKEDQIRCREGFQKLLEKAGFAGKMPRLTACGSRNSAFGDFQTAFANAKAGQFVAMLIDSEDPVADAEQAWAHLKTRDYWEKPIVDRCGPRNSEATLWPQAPGKCPAANQQP